MTATSSTAPRGPEGRVAQVHRQTRSALRLVAAFLFGSGLAAVFDLGASHWVAVHLFLVGALLIAMSAGTQFLSVTWSAASPAPDPLVATQRWLLAAGALGLAGTDLAGAPGWTTGVAGAAVVLALVLLGVALVGIRRSATVDRFLPALDSYLVAIGFGVFGAALGALLAAGVFDGRYTSVRGAHLSANLLGLAGVVVAGTLPYMAATQARTKMSSRATPGAVWTVVTTMAAAGSVVVLGELTDDRRLVASGLAVHALVVVVLATLLPRIGTRQLGWAGPRLVQLLTGVAWWACSVAALAWLTWDGGDTSGARLALVVGGFAQILTASLAYLAPVVRGGGHERLTAGFRTTRSWLAPVAGNAAAVAALLGARAALLVALGLWLADLGVRAVLLARPARPQ